MSGIRRTLAAVTALASWGCGGSTQSDATQPVVADIVVNPSAPTMTINTQLPLQALVRNAAGDLVPDASVTWTVENAAIASVSPAGVVTALGLGTTQVAASARGKSGIATVTVQRAPVASVVVVPNAVNAGIGGTTQLIAKAYDAGQNELSGRAMVWTTSNADVATVDANGLVTAKAKGTATITATAEGKSGTSQFTISPGAVNKVTVEPSSISMVNGDVQHVSATAVDASGTVLSDRTAIWSSDNTQVVTVFAGEVSAVGRGSARITATVDGISGSAAVTVANAPVASVVVAPASVVAGAKVQLGATVRDTRGVVVTDRVVTWSMPNNPYASINSSTGEVTGLTAGSVTATATSEGKSGSATVTVTAAPVKSVTVAPSSPSVDVGKTQPFSATVIDVNDNPVTNRPVTWSSSNTQVATIDVNSGLATVLAAGTTTIMATAGGVSGSTILTGVPVVTSVSVAPSSPSITQNASTTLTATVKDGAGNALAGQTVTWTTSDATIASLSATSGASVTVTGGLAGTATITATSSGKSGTSTITVTNGTVASVVVTLAATTVKSNTTTTATAVVLDANNRPLQGRGTVSWFVSGGATITASTTVTSTGENSAATATVKGKNVSTTTTATISATISGKSGSATLTVSP